MTLDPSTRVMLTDALRPPVGYRVEIAVGTTYSLNLTSLLLAPLSFALFDRIDSDEIGASDPIRVLEAVRRYAEHTTVFCQAGGIHVPSNYRNILTFVEDSVLEVMPPNATSIFHPKVWALRFINEADERSHRLLVLSRNMTLDRSWDTALVLDEVESGAIDAAPAAEFIRQLPSLALKTVTAARLAELNDLASTLSVARLGVPAPFDDGYLLPIGLSGTSVWPFPDSAHRLLAISPFLTKPAVRAMGKIAAERTLVSREESLELIGSQLLEGWQVNVLQRLAEVDSGDDVGEATPAINEYQGTREGLHAKTFVLDVDAGRSIAVTGSANMTGERWGAAVEFDAVLFGPTSVCGVRTTLEGNSEDLGLSQLLEDYTVRDEGGVTDAAIETSSILENFHRALAMGGPVLHVEPVDQDRVAASLRLTIPDDPPGESRVWLASLPADGSARPLGPDSSWTIAPLNVTPFIAVETTAGQGDARVTRRCVLKAELTGAVDGRRHDAVFSILRSKEEVLRYLVFLLGDPSYEALFTQLVSASSDRWSAAHTAAMASDVALFEPLVRATGRDQDALARVASLVEELRAMPNGEDLVPDGFDELWDAVWLVHRERLK